MSYPNYHSSCSTPAFAFSLNTWVDSASPKDLDCSKQPTAALCCRCDVSWWGSLYCLLHCLLLGPQKCRKAGSGGTSPLGNMSFNCFSQWSMRLASHCSSLWAAVPKCHVLVARDCPTSYLNMLGWFFTCVFFRLALLLNTNSPSPLPLLSASGVTFLMFFLFLSVGLVQVTAECFQCTYDTWWYLGNLLPWLCSPTPPSLDAFCSPKPFPFHLVWATWGNWSWWKSLFSPSSPSLTRICGLGWTPHLSVWVLSCKKKEEGSAEWDTQPGVESSWDGYTGFIVTSWAAEVCSGQHEAFLQALNLHQYLRSFLYLLQMGCNSFLSSFFGLFIFYFKPNNFCTSCQAVYCITFLLSSDTISSLTRIGRFPPALLCLFLLQTLISTLKSKADRMLYPLSAMLDTHRVS